MLWLPLWVHMADSASVAQMLWNHWLPTGVKQAISTENMTVDQLEHLYIFLAAAHDLGKAMPVFQSKPARPLCPVLDERIAENLAAAGLPIKHHSAFKWGSKTPHALATQVLLEQVGCNANAAVILGAHHGKPPCNSMLSSHGPESYSLNYHLGDEGKVAWTTTQQELISYSLALAGFSSPVDIPRPNIPGQVLLSGLLIMTDWIASNTRLFPYMRLEDSIKSLDDNRTEAAWEQFGLTFSWDAENTWMSTDIYSQRFEFDTPNTIQKATLETVRSIHSPGILVLEAPMGAGKTEAALVAAEAFANLSKRSGVFFALPTQATSDSIFPRMLEWVKNLADTDHSIMLAHGKAQFNETFQGLKFFEGNSNIDKDDGNGLIVHDWFEGQKKSLLADFVVGTIDQLLLSALKQKHVMLRHLGLANKVVIIDECHAYDAYMSRYLDMALHWLGAYKVPVVVLSATLPADKREAVINAYLNKNASPKPKKDPLAVNNFAPPMQPEWVSNRGYPLITYTDGYDIRQTVVTIDESISKEVSLLPLNEDAIARMLEDLLSGGGCAGVIVNTVQRAQGMARTLRQHFGQDTVRLLHSRFLAPDRANIEREILIELGKPDTDNHRPQKRILIGTQILEQSLDIDFDIMITDLCPMDLLLQRIGRLHRHERVRPGKLKQAMCLVMGLDSNDFEVGARSIYGEYLLMRTKELLPGQLVLPRDIPHLVQDVYQGDLPLTSEPPGYQKAKIKWGKLMQKKEARADVFRIDPPWTDPKMRISGWLDKDVSDHLGDAAVRDSDESIEILLIQEIKGRLFMLGDQDGSELLQNRVPEQLIAKTLARQRIRLPNKLCGARKIGQTIAELELLNGERLFLWQQSPWLKGELFLILDENMSAYLCGYRLTYNKNDGLLYEKGVETDA